MVVGWLASVTGACARMTLTRADQWYHPSNETPDTSKGVWLQGPRGLSAFCVPEDACASIVSIVSASGAMIHQDRHIADLANQ